MLKKFITEKFKVAGDLLYTIGATVVMQIALHIIIYPLINRYYGEAVTGNILYFIGIVYVFPQAVGVAISNIRLVTRKKMDTSNGDYAGILIVLSVITACISFLLGYSGEKNIGFAFAFAVFSVMYALRTYAQVEFRLNLNFKGYFVYYLIVSVGYIIGLGLYVLTDSWLLIFFTGEALALGYSVWKGNLFKKQKAIGDAKYLYKSVGMILFSTLLRDGVNQFDKIVLKILVSAEMVTYYNALSVVGKSIQMLVGPVNTLILSYLSVKNAKLGKEFFKKFMMCSFGIGALALVGCQIATPIYLHLFYSSFPEKIMSYCFLVNSGLVLGFIASLFNALILSQDKTKTYTMIQTVWAVSYMALAYVFTQMYGIVGLGAVTLAVNTVKLAAGVLLARKCVVK